MIISFTVVEYGAHPSAPLTVSVDALLTTDIALLKEQRSEKSDSLGCDDSHVGCCPGWKQVDDPRSCDEYMGGRSREDDLRFCIL